MVVIKITNNVLEQTVSEEIQPQKLIDYLQYKFLDGFNQPVDIFLNDVLLEVDDYDVELNEDDEVHMIFKPAAEYVVYAAVSALVSYAISQIFYEEPEMPESSATARQIQNPQSVYSLTGNNNSFAAGQVIPTIYGKVKLTPSLVAPPYKTFIDNEEYLYQLMVIGNGSYDINEVLIGNGSIESLPQEIFEYRKFTGADVLGTTITDYINDSYYYTELVNQSHMIENLEVRKAPTLSNSYFKLAGNAIEFSAVYNPDLRIDALTVGSLVTIGGCQFSANNGTYTVQSINTSSNRVYFSDASFTTEPSETLTSSFSYKSYDTEKIRSLASHASADSLYNNAVAQNVYDVTLNNINKGVHKLASKYTKPNVDEGSYDDYYHLDFYTKISGLTQGSLVLVKEFTRGTTEFNTTYGPYTLYGPADIEEADITEIDLYFPNGIYDLSGSTLVNRTIDLTVIVSRKGSNGTWYDYTFPLSYTDSVNKPLRKTERLLYSGGLNQEEIKLAIRRDTDEATTQAGDKVILVRAKTVFDKSYGNQEFGDVTFLWTKMRTSNAIGIQGENSISAWVTRSDVGNTVADVVTDIVTNTNYGAGLSPTILDLPATTETINGAFESEITVAEALKVAGNAGRYLVRQENDKITLIKDDSQAVSVAIFNETNIIKDSFTVNYTLGQTRDIDGYRVLYRDPVTFQESEAIYPSTSDRPEVVEMWGCTDATLALEEATYLWTKYLYRRSEVSFSTDMQGYIPSHNDRITVAHSLFKNSQPAEVTSATNTGVNEWTFAFTDYLDTNLPTPTQCILKQVDGSPLTLPILSTTPNSIVVSLSDTYNLVMDYSQELPKVSLGVADTMSKDYTITSIKPSGDNIMNITAVNYAERVFEPHWTTGWVVSGTATSYTLNIEPTYVEVGGTLDLVRLSKTFNIYGAGNITGTVSTEGIGSLDITGTLKIYTDETKTSLLHTVTVSTTSTPVSEPLNYTTGLDSVFIELETSFTTDRIRLTDLEIN